MRRFICIVTLCFIMAALFSGCGILEKFGFGKDDEELTPTSSIAIGEEEAAELSDKVPVHLYFADENNEKLKLEVRYIPISEAAKSVSHLASIVVEELINGPANEGLQPTIPAGTKLLPPVSVDSGVATVNLSKEFVENHPGGKAAEQMSIYSIVNSLTELKDVSTVTFTVEGQPRKDLKGSFAFDMPFPRSVALISTEVESVDQVSKSEDKKDDSKKDDTADPANSPGTSQSPGAEQSTQTGSQETGSSANTPSPTGSPSGTTASPTGSPAGTTSSEVVQQEVPSSGSLYDEETGEILE